MGNRVHHFVTCRHIQYTAFVMRFSTIRILKNSNALLLAPTFCCKLHGVYYHTRNSICKSPAMALLAKMESSQVSQFRGIIKWHTTRNAGVVLFALCVKNLSQNEQQVDCPSNQHLINLSLALLELAPGNMIWCHKFRSRVIHIKGAFPVRCEFIP